MSTALTPLPQSVTPTPEARALVLAQRMLRRLPPSLWDQGLETPQGKLYQAIAEELARWLEAWAIVRQCTLLQEADGVDLDTLLWDYALKRYNQRPDAYARQVARQILWTPQGTLYSLQEVARLLTDTPQLLGRSGRLQPHWWLAATRPITMPRTYWQLGDALGEVWYLSLQENDLVLSQWPPPGANVTPWPDGYSPIPGGGPPAYAGGWEDVATLYWFRVPDATRRLWYVSVGEGGSARLSLERPGPEPGTAVPLQLLDGNGEVWGLTVDHETVSLVLVPLTTPLRTPSYWRLVDTDGREWLLLVSQGSFFLDEPPAPLLWQDVTPGGVPLAWLALTRDSTTRYMQLLPQGVLALVDTQPAGPGTSEALTLRDLHGGDLWSGGLDLLALALQLTPVEQPPVVSGDPVVVLNPGFVAQYLTLHDQAGLPWHLWRSPVEFAVSDQAPLTHQDATPPGGPFTWWRLRALSGEPSAVYPDAGDCLAVGRPAPAGTGTADPQAMGDEDGALWHFGIAPDGSLGLSDWPPVDFDQAATCLVMNDNDGGRWYWRLHPETGELVMSAVLEPNTIPWQPLGELGYVRDADNRDVLPWYITPGTDHEVCVCQAPPLQQPWGLDAHQCPVIDTTGRPWLLSMDTDGSIQPVPGQVEDIPPLTPTLYARDCIEALRHVEGAGSITTMWVA
jgi:hypothetical protein